LSLVAGHAWAQSSGTIEGVVKDPSGAAVASAKVEISYSVSGFYREAVTGTDGSFKITNTPFNTYHTVVTAAGFAPYTQDVDVRSAVPTKIEISLKLSTEVTSVTVTEKAADLIETEPSFHIVDVIGGSSLQAPIRSGQRNQFNAGFQQAFGKYLVVDADYLWKYTHNAYDFSAFANTPIFFPIAWKNSKIDGPSVRVSLPNFHGLTAFAVLAHVRARYFPPQIGGLGATVTGGEVFRIDHDQAFNQTTHLQYQPRKRLPWVGFNWRYDSGLVASNPLVADFPSALGLDADQQTAIGLFCVDAGGVMHDATLATPLNSTICGNNPTRSGARLLNIPAVGKGNLDRNPTRVAPRSLFDASVGDDDLFHGDHYKWSLRFTALNLTNKLAVYNFLSTSVARISSPHETIRPNWASTLRDRLDGAGDPNRAISIGLEKWRASRGQRQSEVL
jgi:hypothetical protein